jgi:crotonobetainyl-CoA:carnitine CoA-transferase CaiB-like acyl-CoA transferase
MLNHLTVIDCSTVLAGPSVGTFFAELGAKVIKIENPNVPDVTRSWKLKSEEKTSPVSAYFSSVNYLKEYRKLDLKLPADREELFKLFQSADIFLSNFKFGDDQKLGINDQILQEKFPQLIIGKINGFGDESDRVAYDLILQAETGFMSMNGTRDSGPVKMPVALIDVLAAHHLKEGILTALLERTSTNKGKVVTVSLYDAAISSLANQASNYLMENHIPQPIGSLHPNIAPYGELFQTADNKTITFAIGSDKHFSILCNFLELKELPAKAEYNSNVERVKNRVMLKELLQKKIQRFSSTEITGFMHEHHVPVGVIQSLNEVFEKRSARELIREEVIERQVTKRITQVAFKYK